MVPELAAAVGLREVARRPPDVRGARRRHGSRRGRGPRRGRTPRRATHRLSLSRRSMSRPGAPVRARARASRCRAWRSRIRSARSSDSRRRGKELPVPVGELLRSGPRTRIPPGALAACRPEAAPKRRITSERSSRYARPSDPERRQRARSCRRGRCRRSLPCRRRAPPSPAPRARRCRTPRTRRRAAARPPSRSCSTYLLRGGSQELHHVLPAGDRESRRASRSFLRRSLPRRRSDIRSRYRAPQQRDRVQRRRDSPSSNAADRC